MISFRHTLKLSSCLCFSFFDCFLRASRNFLIVSLSLHRLPESSTHLRISKEVGIVYRTQFRQIILKHCFAGS